MRVVVMTSSPFGMSAHGLAALLGDERIEVAGLVVSRGLVVNRRRFYERKLKKFLWQVGPTGVIAGGRIRRILDKRALGLRQSAIELAEQRGVPVHTVDLLNCESTEALLRDLRPEVGLSLGNGLIRPSVYSIPPRGTLNVHHGRVPEYRGGPPVFWEALHREPEVGYTIHKLDRHTDTGDVFAEGSLPIEYRGTLAETMRGMVIKLYEASAARLAAVVADFDGYEQRARRQHTPGYNTTPSLWAYWRAERACREMSRAQASRARDCEPSASK